MKTKKVLVSVFTLLIISVNLFAQGSDSIQSRKGDWMCCERYNGHGGVTLRVSDFNGNAHWTYGFNGAFQLTKHFALGAGGYSSVNSIISAVKNNIDEHGQELRFGYGGIMPEFFLFNEAPIGICFSAILGGGGYSINNSTGGNFYVVEPHISFGLKTSKHTRIDIGTSYRYTFGGYSPRIESSLFSGTGIYIQFRYGIFNKNS